MNKAYVILLLGLYAVLATALDFLPRPTYSALEKRDLAPLPRPTRASLASGAYTDSLSLWFSDTEPLRDHFMALSMRLKSLMALRTGGAKAISFHATKGASLALEPAAEERRGAMPDDSLRAYHNRLTREANAKVADAGIIIVGEGRTVRALMGFGGARQSGVSFAQMCNTYQEAFPEAQVYCMVIPTAAAFYLPDEARDLSRPQLPTLRNIRDTLAPRVRFVNIYNALGRHAREPIYLRTDHHWAPLGAYYAAREFARVARVPFHSIRDTTRYRRRVVHGYVGTMYGYSKDIAIKNAPEDFVYWEPTRARDTTTYINYHIDRNYRVVGEDEPLTASFFGHFKDGSTGAYCTFMGGDAKITQVKTAAAGHRRLLILKDSFGNPLPAYLFYSFEQIHVVDARYFTRNMRRYVRDHRITDILFANNIFEANGKKYQAYLRFLDQEDR